MSFYFALVMNCECSFFTYVILLQKPYINRAWASLAIFNHYVTGFYCYFLDIANISAEV